jgi:N-acetylglucosamine-6-phosphate deacetylase
MCDMIRNLKAKGIVVSGGHDDADTSSIEQAVNAGMTHSTHIFCVMSTLHMKNNCRYCGLCEYSLVSDRITTEMIADNHHIPPLLATLIYKCKGAEKLCLISDCLRIGGMPEDGKIYSLGNSNDISAQKIMIYNGVGILADKTRYAGSIQSLDKMIANVVNYSQIPFLDAVRMASLTPAQVIGADDKIGSIEVGKQADFCIMDKDYRVVETICKGETVYQKI